MRTALLLADGFEDAEAVIIHDILSRLGVPVEIISCSGDKRLKSCFSMTVSADYLLSDVCDRQYDAVIIPGGPQATIRLAKDPEVLSFIARHDSAGKWICALCSASVRVLATGRLLKGRHYTCSGDGWRNVGDEGVYEAQNVVVDGNLITGRGLGLAFDFAFTVAGKLTGDRESVKKQAEHIYHEFR